MKLYNLTENKVVVENLKIAEKYSEKMKGLLGRNEIAADEGLLIKNCNWVHTFFMKFPIDIVFLKAQITSILRLPRRPAEDGQIKSTDYAGKGIYKVIKILYNKNPWQIGSPVWEADSVLELKAGTSSPQAKNLISIGDELEIVKDL